ncbi:mediator of RNA polymerase II transcription subunit 18-like [Lingula anatina]|uniref:Mediator of RNA polymerase II transcription subunit 18 n=1 Tax=Lingula anatina TaxID=7574 RepID=A0A1S3H671_LINAN|nr:mediator of RNA polymerase II transcription subunit 18-like [Lingula anatina]|eukprot:XP_013381615.1 mediator of RNA polymerase II transcription subunit 18-like [Lingula anatina]
MESMLAAMNKKIVPLQEYFLQGSVLDASRDILLHRLRGICDNIGGIEKFQDHEMVYTIGTNANNVLQLRARRALDDPEAPWLLRYVGEPDFGDRSKHTLVRSSIDVGTSDNLVQFLTEMGFRLDHEFVVSGHFFRKGRMKITVSKIYRLLQPGDTDKVEALSKSYLVELGVVTVSGQDQVQEEMKNFAEHLKPLVHLEKTDLRKLQQMGT